MQHLLANLTQIVDLLFEIRIIGFLINVQITFFKLQYYGTDISYTNVSEYS